MNAAEPNGLHFPEYAKVPESKQHLRLRTLLWQFLDHAFSRVAAVGCDQFVYWDPTDPRVCLAPDAFVRFGTPDDDFRIWRAWERGAPHVAVEIISPTDDLSWERKLERYERLGVQELVSFDPDVPEQPLRVWDRVGENLVERNLAGPCAESRLLNGYWLPVVDAREGLTLRLSHDEQGERLFLTLREAEQRRADHEAERANEASERANEASERASQAERRIAELEAELRRRG